MTRGLADGGGAGRGFRLDELGAGFTLDAIGLGATEGDLRLAVLDEALDRRELVLIVGLADRQTHVRLGADAIDFGAGALVQGLGGDHHALGLGLRTLEVRVGGDEGDLEVAVDVLLLERLGESAEFLALGLGELIKRGRAVRELAGLRLEALGGGLDLLVQRGDLRGGVLGHRGGLGAQLADLVLGALGGHVRDGAHLVELEATAILDGLALGEHLLVVALRLGPGALGLGVHALELVLPLEAADRDLGVVALLLGFVGEHRALRLAFHLIDLGGVDAVQLVGLVPADVLVGLGLHELRVLGRETLEAVGVVVHERRLRGGATGLVLGGRRDGLTDPAVGQVHLSRLLVVPGGGELALRLRRVDAHGRLRREGVLRVAVGGAAAERALAVPVAATENRRSGREGRNHGGDDDAAPVKSKALIMHVHLLAP